MAGPSDDNSNEERTEPATQFRREEFRRSGNVALSRELLSVLILMAVGGTLYIAVSMIFREFSVLSELYLGWEGIPSLGKAEFLRIVVRGLGSVAWMVAPLFAVTMIVGVLVCVAQVGFHITWEPLSPNWDRINPVSGFKRLFSLKSSVEAAKALFKVGLAALITFVFLKSQAPKMSVLMSQPLPGLAVFVLITVAKVFFLVLLALLVMAILDYAFQRFQLEKKMRMTRRETKEEFKLREGDPLIKSRIRNIQRRMANRRMMDEVPKADAVVTNPTHFAVALRYDREQMHAPKVTAKGKGHLALKIKEIARFNQVPIVENKPLARSLYKQLEVGQFIPKELYKAVAEVLAYVYRLKQGMGHQQNLMQPGEALNG